MNASAQKHLVKAKGYLAKGEEFYRKAKVEIDAALGEGASLREVSRYLDRSKDWVADVRDWDGKGALYGKDTKARQIRQAKQVLRENPEAVTAEITQAMRDPELVREVVSDKEAHRTTFMATHPSRTERTPVPYRDPTFIDLIVKASSTLIELRSLLTKCEDASEIPPEFSETSMDDIAAKAMQIKEMVRALRSDSNDEWQRIVRELREA